MKIEESLFELLRDCTELILIEYDSVKALKLRQQIEEINAKFQELINKNINQDTAAYKATIEGIREAHEAVREAMKDLGKVGETIEKMALVVDLVAKVLLENSTDLIPRQFKVKEHAGKKAALARHISHYLRISSPWSYLRYSKSKRKVKSPVTPIDDVSPAFYFVLEGKAVRGNLVKVGSDVDLVFNYDTPPPEVLAMLKGARLDEIRKQNIDIGITVIPRGFIFRDNVWYQTARFKKATLEEPVRFHLRAADQVIEGSGFYIIFDARGCVMYQFFLEVQLVPKIPAKRRSAPIRKQLDLDLAELISEKERAEEAMRMML